MKKQDGNISELLATGICVLAMTIVMLAYLDNVALIQQKAEVSQLARKYILRMETVGYLTGADKTILQQELTGIGMSDVDLSGTTLQEVSYGDSITLHIRGKLKEQYELEEQRVSTAKN